MERREYRDYGEADSNTPQGREARYAGRVLVTQAGGGRRHDHVRAGRRQGHGHVGQLHDIFQRLCGIPRFLDGIAENDGVVVGLPARGVAHGQLLGIPVHGHAESDIRVTVLRVAGR